MSRRHAVMLAALAAIWGASFMFIKVAVRELEPVTLVWLRITLAALVLLPVTLTVVGRGAFEQARAAAGRLTFMGLVNSAIPFTLLSWAETRLDSGPAAILQAAAPLFTVLIAMRVGDDRVNGSRLAGVLLGFIGVALLVGARTGGGLAAALAVLLTALCYASAGVFGAHTLRDTHPFVVGAGSMAIAAVLTAPFGIATLPSSLPGWKETGSVLALGIVGTGVAYMLFFAILRGAGASRSILVTYLVPAVALAYGALLLGEPLRASSVTGLVLILAGVALGAGYRRSAATPVPSATHPARPVRSTPARPKSAPADASTARASVAREPRRA
jgi:drug/metabolite transporter (DMT)-like permease